MSTLLTQLGRTMTQNASSVQKAVAANRTELADFTGISVSTLARIEKARKARRTYNPAFKTVVKLAEFAGVSIDDFVKSRLTFRP